MNNSSQNEGETPKVRRPQRSRGRERVQQLLEAGAAVFVDKGFEAATMTEIAARAKASIGSLYQFFPNKELLADSLHSACIESIAALLDNILENAATKTAAQLANEILVTLGDFITSHPEFAVLAERRGSSDPKKKQVRELMREKIQTVISAGTPKLAMPLATDMAVIILHLMKVQMALYQEDHLDNREQIVQHLTQMLGVYLDTLTATR